MIVPMVETGGGARSIVDAVRYPPHGKRSFGPRRPPLRYGSSYAERVPEVVITLAMIETATALMNLDDILAVDGLDGIFVGPSDLALALGLPPSCDPAEPRLINQIRDIRKRTHTAGKRAGIFCPQPTFARTMVEEGYDLVAVSADLALLTRAAAEAHKLVRSPG